MKCTCLIITKLLVWYLLLLVSNNIMNIKIVNNFPISPRTTKYFLPDHRLATADIEGLWDHRPAMGWMALIFIYPRKLQGNNKLAHNTVRRLTSSSKEHWGRSCTFITLAWQLNRSLCVKGNGCRVGRGGGELFSYLCIYVLVIMWGRHAEGGKTYLLCFKNLHWNSIWIKGKPYCLLFEC
jgi:hypothetical protein